MSTRTRRANGEASYHRDPKTGRWHGYVTLGRKPDGSPDRRHRRGKTRSEVVAKILALVKAHDAARTLDPDATTVEQWLTHWLHTAADQRRLRVKTLASYRTDITKHLIPGLGQVRLNRLSWEQIEAFEAAMRDQTYLDRAGQVQPTYRPATIDHVRRTLRSALNDAVRSKLIAFNPVTQVRRFVGQSTSSRPFEAKFLSNDEFDRVVRAAMQSDTGFLHIIRLVTGLRQGELLGLSWSNVHVGVPFERIVISQQLQRHTYRHGCGLLSGGLGNEIWSCGRLRGADCPRRGQGGLVLVRVKTTSGERVIPLGDVLPALLRAHRKAQAAKRLAAGPSWQDLNLVFTRDDGGMIDPRVDAKDWKSLLARAGVAPVRLHDARHTAATNMLDDGVDDRLVMELLGWSSPAMLRRYQHVRQQRLSDAMTLATSRLAGPCSVGSVASAGTAGGAPESRGLSATDG